MPENVERKPCRKADYSESKKEKKMNKIMFPLTIIAIAIGVVIVIVLQKIAAVVDTEDEIYGV